jgi:hypothetical protein
MDAITTLLFGHNRGVNVLELDWDHLIVLDACRCDIFEMVYEGLFPSATSFRCIQSPASSTMEFVKKSIIYNLQKVRDKLRNTVFVNANPVIDHVLGPKARTLFYKYSPVWKHYWDNELGTVKPEDTYMVSLRAYIKNPDKKFIIWFLQPHFPYLDKRFDHINALGRELMKRTLHIDSSSNLFTLFKIAKNLIKNGYLCAGIPDKLCEYMRIDPKEVISAYIVNLIKALYYVKRLTEILPGRIMITSDHGEAFGECVRARKTLLRLRVYGHPSRIPAPHLTQIPLLTIENSIPNREAIRGAIRYLISLTSKRLRSA